MRTRKSSTHEKKRAAKTKTEYEEGKCVRMRKVEKKSIQVKNTRRKKKYTGHDHLSLFARDFLWSESVLREGYTVCSSVSAFFGGYKTLRRRAVSRAISCLDHRTYSPPFSAFIIRLCAAFLNSTTVFTRLTMSLRDLGERITAPSVSRIGTFLVLLCGVRGVYPDLRG